MLALLAASFLLFPSGEPAETTVTVRPGSRLELNNFEGDITIATWNRNAVQVRADGEDDAELRVEVSGNIVSVRVDPRGGPGSADFRLMVPADIDLSLSGQSGDISIDGTRGEISVETVEGNITVRGGNGFVSLHSVEGTITISGARGRLDLNSVDGEIRVSDASGDIRAQTVDGEISLERVESSNVDANTVDGAITFDGVFRPDGRYHLVSHDGDVTVTVPEINGSVSVSTFSGSFESDFPVTITTTRPGKRLNFDMGSGKARVELESFDGSIRIRKSGRH